MEEGSGSCSLADAGRVRHKRGNFSRKAMDMKKIAVSGAGDMGTGLSHTSREGEYQPTVLGKFDMRLISLTVSAAIAMLLVAGTVQAHLMHGDLHEDAPITGDFALVYSMSISVMILVTGIIIVLIIKKLAAGNATGGSFKNGT